MAGKKKSIIKKLHKWPSLVIAVFILLWAGSGIILNHRHTFSSFDVNRQLLPAEHHYNNWNNAAVRASVRIDSNLVLFYGNVGIWKYETERGVFSEMINGLPSGADHHKINCISYTSGKNLYAGTRFGLYTYDEPGEQWQQLHIPHHDRHVVDMMEMRDSLWVMTRSHLWSIPLEGDLTFSHIEIPAPLGYDNKVGLFKTLWVIHSGEIYGLAGKLLVDFVAFIFIFLTLSGLVYFFFPRMIKKRKRTKKKISRLASWTRWSVKWHNKIGIWLAIILIITTFTGMFLRPPLLIAIAGSRVPKVPYSMLDDGNPWHDQLRRIVYDSEKDLIYLASLEGIYTTDGSFSMPPRRISPQPPVSVMGYNVFELLPHGNILVGSFTGLYLWAPESGAIYDYISGLPFDYRQAPSMPVSANMVAGFHREKGGREYVFDYNRGVYALRHDGRFQEMPPMIKNTPMPLWNFALEVHTARLFKPFMGDLYILFIPLFGLSTLTILISGVILWIRKYNRKRK
ncbi:MAG: PepSY-associated TM helix domain-containing protein [Bacteroidales bacterium]|nr:PepSY-associated TM helix domain-containing protein [Bacteroidales bacterium]